MGPSGIEEHVSGLPPRSSAGVGPSWRALIAFGLATRIVVLALGVLLANRGEGVTPDAMANDVERTDRSKSVVAAWYEFDAVWYLRISEEGYSYEPGVQSTAAFMPLLPLVMAAGSVVGLDPRWIGLIVPNLAFAIGLALLRADRGATCRRHRDSLAGERAADRLPVGLLLLCPVPGVARPGAYDCGGPVMDGPASDRVGDGPGLGQRRG